MYSVQGGTDFHTWGIMESLLGNLGDKTEVGNQSAMVESPLIIYLSTE
jgi:hypothetical protein